MATRATDALTVTWDGDKNSELRMMLALKGETPVIRELAVRHKGQEWVVMVSNAVPEFRVVSGLRRITNQQLTTLTELGVKVTPELVNQFKWDAFWDAPLNVPGGKSAHGGSTPPQDGIFDQPGLPRKAEEVTRTPAVYRVRSCEVKSNGGRLEISFPGVTVGVFTGRLQYTVYRGINLIRQEIIAKTSEPSVAYKYDAGISGLTIRPGAKVVWRDVRDHWKNAQLDGRGEGSPGPDGVIVKAANRLLAAEGSSGAVAVFPPPHNFFWAREVSYNLGYNWYRKDDAGTFALGVRQAENEASPGEANRGAEDRRQNFALRSARPDTWQRMPVYLYVGLDAAQSTVDAALTFTRNDHFKALPGYLVMATHFHMALVSRAMREGGLSATVPDLEVLKQAGVNIVAPIDSFSGANRVQGMARYYEAARRQSGKNFWVMPNEEVLRGPLSTRLGGHNDVLLSHPVYWVQGRSNGQPLVEDDASVGKIYHIGNVPEMMEMARREKMLIYMPHPRSKGSTGFPDVIKATDHFRDPNYRGIGFRWGMGLDGSEIRLSDYRCLPTLDDMNNWIADLPTPPKYLQATSEIYQQSNGDDIYANNPVNYVKAAAPARPDDFSTIIQGMSHGDYFVTSGEVLIPSYAVEGTGPERTIVAQVEWTFPLDFVEVVWGDGKKTQRQIVSTTDLPAFGTRQFRIRFPAAGKKWVRFAAWDSAGNGATVQPVKLDGGK